jgi:hypothetical protein
MQADSIAHYKKLQRIDRIPTQRLIGNQLHRLNKHMIPLSNTFTSTSTPP